MNTSAQSQPTTTVLPPTTMRLNWPVPAAPSSAQAVSSTAHAQATALLQAGNFAGAEEVCARQLLLVPTDVDNLQLLSGALMGLRRAEDASRVLTSALSLTPQNPGLWFNLAQALLRLPQPNPERAMQALDRALALAPQDKDAQKLKALMVKLSQLPQAVQPPANA